LSEAERFTIWWADMRLRASHQSIELEALTEKERRRYLKETTS
jgi:hypothetical protein